MTRPRIDPSVEDGKTRTFTIALPRALVESLDEYARIITAERLDTRVTRAAAMRDLLIDGLARWRAAREAEGKEVSRSASPAPARQKPARIKKGKEGRKSRAPSRG